MQKRDGYHWRLFATGLSFIVFGLGCVVLGLIVFPVMRLLPGGELVHRARARRAVGMALRAFVGTMRALGVLTWRFEGTGRLGRPGQLIVVNHPSLIDVVFLLGFAPGSSCVVKDALWRNPFTRWPVVAAGYVSNQPTDAMIERAAEILGQGQHVIIFPEGTRTRPGEPLQFHRGAATIAIRAATVVTPVYVRCEPPTLAKNAPWYRIPERRVHFGLRVGEDIDPAPFRESAPGPIAARALNAHLLKLFTTELTPLAPTD